MTNEPLRRRVARSPLAPLAALPVRAAAVARYDGHLLRESGRWLLRSREHTNFTYSLTDRNLQHLVWWVADLAGVNVDQARSFMAELDADDALRSHIQSATAASGRRRLADPDVRYGRRVGWYALTRALRPSLVVETGTDKGLGSCVFAAALIANGTGRLQTIDVNPDSGYLISGRYADVTDRIVGDSVAALQKTSGEVGLFLHDSLHSFEHETRELEAVAPRLSDRSLVLSDNA